MSKQVFISHSSEDHAVARKVYEFLKSDGIDCFMDDYDLRPGDEFVTKIPEAIRGSSVVVLIFSTNSDNSSDVTKELELARTGKKLIIPVRVEKLLPHNLAWILAGITWIDAFQPPLEGPLRKLAERIRSILGQTETGRVPRPPKLLPGRWYEIDYKDLNDWAKERIKVIDSGKQLVARTFIYRKNRDTRKYERKLKEPDRQKGNK